MTEYTREQLLEFSKKLNNKGNLYAELAHDPKIKDEAKKEEFREISKDLIFQSTDIEEKVIDKDVDFINALTVKLTAASKEINDTFQRLQELENIIQIAGATVGILAELVQIGAKIAKFAA